MHSCMEFPYNACDIARKIVRRFIGQADNGKLGKVRPRRFDVLVHPATAQDGGRPFW